MNFIIKFGQVLSFSVLLNLSEVTFSEPFLMFEHVQYFSAGLFTGKRDHPRNHRKEDVRERVETILTRARRTDWADTDGCLAVRMRRVWWGNKKHKQ